MAKDIQVLIIEDDPYARDLMTLLLTRDWRTRVIGEIANQHELRDFIEEFHPPVDVVIVDTEIPGEPDRLVSGFINGIKRLQCAWD